MKEGASSSSERSTLQPLRLEKGEYHGTRTPERSTQKCPALDRSSSSRLKGESHAGRHALYEVRPARWGRNKGGDRPKDKNRVTSRLQNREWEGKRSGNGQRKNSGGEFHCQREILPLNDLGRDRKKKGNRGGLHRGTQKKKEGHV